jgi:hypothetical protein
MDLDDSPRWMTTGRSTLSSIRTVLSAVASPPTSQADGAASRSAVPVSMTSRPS